MNKFKLEITVKGRTYVEYFTSNLSGNELRDALQYNTFFYIERPNKITMYNANSIDIINIIQE